MSAQPSRMPLSTIRLEDGRTVRIFAPTDDLWIELNQMTRSSEQRQPFGVLRTIVSHCTDATFEGSPKDLGRLVLALLKTWDNQDQMFILMWWRKKARLELEQFYAAYSESRPWWV